MNRYLVPAVLYYFLEVEGFDLEDAKRRFTEEPNHVRYTEEEVEEVKWSEAILDERDE